MTPKFSEQALAELAILNAAEARVLDHAQAVVGMYEKNGDAMNALIEDIRPGTPGNILVKANGGYGELNDYIAGLSLAEVVRYQQLVSTLEEWAGTVRAVLTNIAIDRAEAEVRAERAAAAAAPEQAR